MADQPKSEKEGEPSAAPLTKAEKKKLKILQKKQEKEALITRLEIGDVQKEIDMAKKTHGIASKKWKEICMKEGRSEYKDWMMEQWNLFEHLISIKDEIIHELVEDLHITKNNRHNRFQEHVQMTHKLTDDFVTDIEDIKEKFTAEKIDLLSKHEIKLQEIGEEHQYMEDYMKTILFLIEKKRTENELFWSSEFISKVDEENNQNQNDYEIKCFTYEKALNELYKDYTTVVQEYKKGMEKSIDKSNSIRERVLKEDKLINDEVKMMRNLEAIIEKDRDTIRKGEPMINQLGALRTERNTLSKLYNSEKRRLHHSSKDTQEQLKYLVSSSNETLKYLRTINALGEKILKFYQICKKLETQTDDQKLPFRRDRVGLNVAPVDAVHTMMKFWKRVSYAEIVRGFLRNNLRVLRKRNAKLKTNLKKTLDSERMASITRDIKKCSYRF